MTRQSMYGTIFPIDLRKSVRMIAEGVWLRLGASQHPIIGDMTRAIIYFASQTDEVDFQCWLADMYFLCIVRCTLSDLSSLSLMRRRTVETIVSLTKSRGLLENRDTHFDPFLFRLGQCVEGKVDKWATLQFEAKQEVFDLIGDVRHALGVYLDLEYATLQGDEEQMTELTIKLMKCMKNAGSYGLYYSYLLEMFQSFVEYGSFSQAAHTFMVFVTHLRWSKERFPYSVNLQHLSGLIFLFLFFIFLFFIFILFLSMKREY